MNSRLLLKELGIDMNWVLRNDIEFKYARKNIKTDNSLSFKKIINSNKNQSIVIIFSKELIEYNSVILAFLKNTFSAYNCFISWVNVENILDIKEINHHIKDLKLIINSEDCNFIDTNKKNKSVISLTLNPKLLYDNNYDYKKRIMKDVCKLSNQAFSY